MGHGSRREKLLCAMCVLNRNLSVTSGARVKTCDMTVCYVSVQKPEHDEWGTGLDVRNDCVLCASLTET